MNPNNTSRREFALVTGGVAAGRLALPAATRLDARDIVQQIRMKLGGDWPETGLDGFKAGNPDTEVRGVATTAMATVEVLRRAAKAGLNLILTYEPTFFGVRDEASSAPSAPGGRGRGPAPIASNDPVYLAK